MAKQFAFSLVCPEHELASGEAWQIVAPGTEGAFGVLANHAPLVSSLKIGLVRILSDESGKQEQRFWVRGGFAEVSADGLIILVEEAVDLAQTKAEWAINALEQAKAESDPSLERIQWLEGLRDSLRH